MSQPNPEPDFTDPDRRPLEIRLALAMSGGIGLAVWMGGVTVELLRLVRADDRDVCGRLLRELRATATIDVVGGVSAGGLNGAFLAYALANGVESLTPLRNVWIENGSFDVLLRAPLERNAPSLLAGDTEFLPRLRRALAGLPRGRSRLRHDLDLFIGASLLDPVPLRYLDSLGGWMYETDHRGLFHFRHLASTSPRPADLPQLLSIDAAGELAGGDHPGGGSQVLDRLALAVRSSASFPGAFEASFVPVGEKGDSPDHPDMGGVLRGSHPGSPPVKSSRFVVDGGALRNKPIGPTLQAIFARPAERNVRRVLVFIDPDPAVESREPHCHGTEPPSLAQVILQSVVTMPRNQMVGDDIAAIWRSNERAHVAGIFRRTSGVEALSDQHLLALAQPLLASYLGIRAAASADRTLKTVLEHLPRSESNAAQPLEFTPVALRASLVKERRRYLPVDHPGVCDFPARARAMLAELGLLPLRLGPEDARDPAQWKAALEHRQGSIEAWTRRLPDDILLPGPDEPLDRVWSWGIATVSRFATESLAAVRTAMEDLARHSRDPMADPLWLPLATLRRQVHGILQAISQARSEDAEYWRMCAGQLEQATDIDKWAQSTYRYWPKGSSRWAQDSAALQLWMAYLAALAAQAIVVLRGALASPRSGSPSGFELSGLLVDRLLPTPSNASGNERDEWERVFRRLAALEIIRVGTGADVEGDEQAVELVQFSSRSIDPIRHETDNRHKVTSIQLGHFGAFYKASWRANDFLWGRVDGTTQLVRLLIDGGGLIQPGDTALEVKERVGRILSAQYEPRWAGPPGLEGEWDQACREIDQVMRASVGSHPEEETAGASPQRLLKTGDLIAKAAILEYLPEELRAVGDAVVIDKAACAASERAERFLRRADDLLPPMCATTPAQDSAQVLAVQEVFKSCHIGEDRIKDELGSDYLTHLTAQSGAVAVSALGSAFSKVKWFGKLVARTLRGGFLTAYLMAGSVVGAGKRIAGPIAVVGVYALAALLFGWAISDKPPVGVPPAAAVLTTAALLFAVARNWWTRGRRLLMILSLVATALACVAAGALPWIGGLIWDADESGASDAPAVFAFFRSQRAFVVTGLLLIGFLVLGAITVKPRSAPPLRESPTRGPASEA